MAIDDVFGGRSDGSAAKTDKTGFDGGNQLKDDKRRTGVDANNENNDIVQRNHVRTQRIKYIQVKTFKMKNGPRKIENPDGENSCCVRNSRIVLTKMWQVEAN